MGRHILPEAFLFALRARLGKPGSDNKPIVVREGPLSAMETTWMVHMLKGGGIKSAPGLPFQLTKGAAHLFNVQPLQLPHERFVHAHRIVWRHLVMTELIASGADGLLAEMSADLVDEQNCRHWVPVFQELILKGYERGSIREAFDFLRSPRCNIGLAELHGISKRNLDRRIEEWHVELEERKVTVPKGLFPDNGIPPWHTRVGHRKYLILQLRNSEELYQEGLGLHHCVTDYAWDCFDGRFVIYSLRHCTTNRQLRMVTIQVEGGGIVQVKGAHNRQPTALEEQIIREWVRLNATQIPHGIRLF